MKKIFLLFLLFVLILSELTISTSADTLIPASRFYSYKETGVGFIIPEGWEQAPVTFNNTDAQLKSPYSTDEIILFHAYHILGDSALLKEFFDRNKYIDNSATNIDEIKSIYEKSGKFDEVDVTETRIGHVDYYEIRLSGYNTYSVMFMRVFYGWYYTFTFVSMSPINVSPGYGDLIKLVSDSTYPYPDSASKIEAATRPSSTTLAPTTDTLPTETTDYSAPMPTDSQEQSETDFNVTSAIFGILITSLVLGISFAIYLIIVNKKSRLTSEEIQKYKNRTEILFFLRSCQELTKEDAVILNSFEYITNELFTIATDSSKKDKRRVSILENELRTLTCGTRFNNLLKRVEFSKRYLTDIESALFSNVYLIKGSEHNDKPRTEAEPRTSFSASFIPEIRSEDFRPHTQHTAPEPNTTVTQKDEMLWCRKCGVQLEPESLFCHKCGERVIGC